MLSVKRTDVKTLCQEEFCQHDWLLMQLTSTTYSRRSTCKRKQDTQHQRSRIQLNELRKRIGYYPNLRTAKAEFKSLQQGESEKIVDYNRRVQKVSEPANAALATDARDLAAKKTFIEGLVEPDVRTRT